MATAETTKTAAAPAAAKPATAAPKAEKPKREPRVAKYDPKGTVHFKKDEKSGKMYGRETNDTTINPKRKNSKSEVWFGNYREGITIEELAKAYEKTGGSLTSNLDWDIKHGFVEYRAPKG